VVVPKWGCGVGIELSAMLVTVKSGVTLNDEFRKDVEGRLVTYFNLLA
jgi:hypothetical protein